MRKSQMRIRIPTAVLPSLTAFVVALAPAVAVSGCGSASTTLDPLASAAEVTSQAGGAHIALSAHIGTSSLPSPITMAGGGFFNYRSHEGTLAVKLDGLPAGTPVGTSIDMEEVFKGGSVYVGSPLFAGKLPGGARWMKIDLARVGKAAGIDPGQLLGGQSNPAQFLEYLKASGGGVQVLGHDSVRGVPTTHYRGTIDLRKAAGVLQGDRGALKAAIEKSIAQIGLSTLPVDVWVDAHRMVRRLDFNIHASVAGAQLSLQLDVELFDFGATPTVNAPASSESFDATSSALGGVGALGG
jgi:hypothetical protein